MFETLRFQLFVPFFLQVSYVYSLLSIDAIDFPLFFTHFQHLKCSPVDYLFYITENTERIKKYCGGKVFGEDRALTTVFAGDGGV
jgi:hypothetical protein